MSPENRRVYGLAANKLALNAEWGRDEALADREQASKRHEGAGRLAYS